MTDTVSTLFGQAVLFFCGLVGQAPPRGAFFFEIRIQSRNPDACLKSPPGSVSKGECCGCRTHPQGYHKAYAGLLGGADELEKMGHETPWIIRSSLRMIARTEGIIGIPSVNGSGKVHPDHLIFVIKADRVKRPSC